MRSRWVFRVLCLGGAIFAVGGAVLLLVGFAREHRDVQRLWTLAVGWLGLGVGALVVMAAIAVRQRGRGTAHPGAEGDG